MSRWSDFPSDGPVAAAMTGPFPYRPFLETVWDHRTEPGDDLDVVVTGAGAVALTSIDGVLAFAGQENLTDYHAPVGHDPVVVLRTALEGRSGPFRFDSLPREAADVVATALVDLGASMTEEQHDVAAVLALPESVDEWLASIGKKERHEVRRKRRKFEAEFGAIEVRAGGVEHLGVFCAMHRTAPGDKGAFMTDAMQAYFGDLLERADATIHLLMCDDVPRAAAFGFERDSGYFYYNSALDPDAAHASPGIVLFSSMIATQIERGAAVFDFLKGDERYKFRHGAEPRPLFVLSGVLP
ncbi:MAG: GNAT family N-acetyltransferase [Acidimicrobiia bacterium]|nr:GNAT family N-acetyltransferase [Acidimicrobiia bacterium]